jgi:hypothetical protein
MQEANGSRFSHGYTKGVVEELVGHGDDSWQRATPRGGVTRSDALNCPDSGVLIPGTARVVGIHHYDIHIRPFRSQRCCVVANAPLRLDLWVAGEHGCQPYSIDIVIGDHDDPHR